MMPDRIISEDVLSSESLAKLSHGAERLFFRLIALVDNMGRFHGDARFIRHSAMSLLDVSVPEVGRWLSELEHEGMICRFEIDGRSFLHMVNWARFQRLRYKMSRFPEHTTCIRSDSQQSAAARGGPLVDVEVEEKKNVSTSPALPTKSSDPSSTDAVVANTDLQLALVAAGIGDAPTIDPDFLEALAKTTYLRSLADSKHASFWKSLFETYDRDDIFFCDEIAKADLWLVANPEKARRRKTAGLPRYFLDWIKREIEALDAKKRAAIVRPFNHHQRRG